MPRVRQGGELDVVPLDGEGGEAANGWEPPAPSSSPARGSRHLLARRGAVALGAVVAVEVAVAAVALAVQHSAPATVLRPSPDAVNQRLLQSRAQIVTVARGELVARAITNGSGGERLLGFITLGPDNVLAIDGATILAQGTGLPGPRTIGPTGTWAFPADGSGNPRYLGPSTSFQSFGDVWLTTPTETLRLHPDGSTEGPYALDGQVVAAVGAGLVVQRGDQVWWWIPGTGGLSHLIGRGVALDGEGEYILWQSADGRLTITDPHSMQAWRTAVTAGRIVDRAVLSPSLQRVAAVEGRTLRLGDGIVGHRVVTLHLGPLDRLRWLDDTTLVASIAPRGLVAIDAASGLVVHEPDLPAGSRGLAILPAAGS